MTNHDIHFISPSNDKSYIANALTCLKGYNKTSSIFHLLSLGLPTLKGVVILHWNARVQETVTDFFDDMDIPQVMMRTDRRGEKGKYLRGGYLLPLGQIEVEVKRVLGIERIAILLEPRSKYDNLYGINALIDFRAEKVYVEAVGPGFDVSDLNRGDVSPHERLKLSILGDQVKLRISDRCFVSQEQYEASVQHRLVKIANDAVRQKWTNCIPENRTGWLELGERFLKSRGETLLLEQHTYTPLPFSCLCELVRYIRDIPWQAKRLAGRDTECILPISIMNVSREFIFWDIVFPSKKYAV